jgi:hypothetical protein
MNNCVFSLLLTLYNTRKTKNINIYTFICPRLSSLIHSIVEIVIMRMPRLLGIVGIVVRRRLIVLLADIFQRHRIGDHIPFNESDVSVGLRGDHVVRQGEISIRVATLLHLPSGAFLLPVRRHFPVPLVRCRRGSRQLLLMPFVAFRRGVFDIDFLAVDDVWS